MANILKQISVVLLIVVLVALGGFLEISCGDFFPDAANVYAEDFTVADEVNENRIYEEVGSPLIGTDENIYEELPLHYGRRPSLIVFAYNKLKRLLGPVTKMKVFVGVVITLIFLFSSGVIYSFVPKTPEKYDIVQEATRVSFGRNRSSYDTEQELRLILRSICEDLPIFTDSPTTFITTELSTTQPDAYTTATTELLTTEATTVKLPTTEDPAPICTEAAESIISYIRDIISHRRKMFLSFDLFSQGHIDKIKAAITNIGDRNCGEDFFRLDDIYHEGLWFDPENIYTKLAMDKDICIKAVNSVLPILDELGYNSTMSCVDDECPLTFSRDTMETELRNGINIAQGVECGDDFFHLSRGNTKFLQYQSSNPHIAEVWPDAVCWRKCQQTADEVISLLYGIGHFSESRFVTKTVYDTVGIKPELKAAYALADDCRCGTGCVTMTESSDKLVFEYQKTNYYAAIAWERAAVISTCRKTAKNVFNNLLELGLYSTDDEASIIIPNRKNNILYVLAKISPGVGLDCGEGFFSYIHRNGFFKVLYKRSNSYILPHFEKVTDEQLCTITTNGVYHVLKAYDQVPVDVSTTIQLKTRQSTRDELSAKFAVVQDLDCGTNYFTPSFEDNYIGINFHGNNEYIQPVWAKARTEKICRESTEAVVTILEELDMYTGRTIFIREITATQSYRNRLKEEIDKTSDVDCGRNYFRYSGPSFRLRLECYNTNEYIAAAWQKIHQVE